MNKRYEDNDEDGTSRVVRFVSSKGANKDARWDKEVDEDEGLGKGRSNNGRLLFRLVSSSCIYESGELTADCRLPTGQVQVGSVHLAADAGQSWGDWDSVACKVIWAPFIHAIQSQWRVAVKRSMFGIRGSNMKRSPDCLIYSIDLHPFSVVFPLPPLGADGR